MSALPAIIALVITLYLRPHEYIEALGAAHVIYIVVGLCFAGVLLDVVRRRTRLAAAPQLGWVLLFLLWCLVTLAVRRPSEVLERSSVIMVDALAYVILACGVQRIQALVKIVTVVFAIGLFVAYVGVDQGLSPFECVVMSPLDRLTSVPDGRPCGTEEDSNPSERAASCLETGSPGIMYGCERPGLFGTTSIGGGRVRYLGTLQDPNDLALATAMAVPFAFAFLQMRRSLLRLALLAVTLALVGAEIVFTQSRGGQLTFVAVLAAYFTRAYGARRGLLVGAAVAIPMLLLGGRSDAAADDSTIERLGCAAAGIRMLVAHPIFGVGYSLFTENHYLTAHNAYILAAGELGIPGMSIFAVILYLSVKIPLNVLRFDLGAAPDGATIKATAMALLAALGGGAVGIYFLSWMSHYVLWIHFGLSGALYSVVKARDPRFACRLSLREAALIVLGYLAFLLLWAGYIRSKGAWE